MTNKTVKVDSRDWAQAQRALLLQPVLLAALDTLVRAVNVKKLDPLIVFASIERARSVIAKASQE